MWVISTHYMVDRRYSSTITSSFGGVYWITSELRVESSFVQSHCTIAVTQPCGTQQCRRVRQEFLQGEVSLFDFQSFAFLSQQLLHVCEQFKLQKMIVRKRK